MKILLELILKFKNKQKVKIQEKYFYSPKPTNIYITGDKHRNFKGVKEFCKEMKTKKSDVLIILGDTGFNYFLDKRDEKLKEEAQKLNITMFCLYGNKEERPENIGTYGICSFCGGKVYFEPKYPNIFFAIDGEIYTFNGKKYIVMGGAHSVDKIKCLNEHKPYFEDEMPGKKAKDNFEKNLKKEKNKIYGILTHTCPIDYLPYEMFMSTAQNAANLRKEKAKKSLNILNENNKENKTKNRNIKQNKKSSKKIKKDFKPDINRETEIWFGEIEKNTNYKIWFCGHYHIDKRIDNIKMMCSAIHPLDLI